MSDKNNLWIVCPNADLNACRRRYSPALRYLDRQMFSLRGAVVIWYRSYDIVVASASRGKAAKLADRCPAGCISIRRRVDNAIKRTRLIKFSWRKCPASVGQWTGSTGLVITATAALNITPPAELLSAQMMDNNFMTNGTMTDYTVAQTRLAGRAI